MTDFDSGNTIPSSKSYQLTLNEVFFYDDVKEYLTNLKAFNYLISCQELAPTTGHKHIHIYCQFDKTIRLSKRKTYGAHIEKCRGTPQQNVAYIKKDGNILDEIGECRNWGGMHLTISELLTLPKDDVPVQYYNTYVKAKSEQRGERYYKPPTVEWHYGPTGSGKTRKAFEDGAENVIFSNGFFSDWGDARIISIEEMRGQIPFDELLRLTDGYHNYYKVNIKGGAKYVDLDKIYITSPKRPEECYPHQRENDCIDQLLRRISVIEEHFIN